MAQAVRELIENLFADILDQASAELGRLICDGQVSDNGDRRAIPVLSPVLSQTGLHGGRSGALTPGCRARRLNDGSVSALIGPGEASGSPVFLTVRAGSEGCWRDW